jgi:hypothetical protein
MAGNSERLVRRLAEECDRTVAFFQGLTPEQWRQTVYTDGGAWTVREVLAHFVAAEYSMTRLLENVLAGGQGAPEDFDLDAYNEKRVSKLQERTAEELLAQFVELRQATIDLVRPLDAVDLGRTGRHPYLGIAALEDIIQLMYRHNGIHQREIRKVLGL